MKIFSDFSNICFNKKIYPVLLFHPLPLFIFEITTRPTHKILHFSFLDAQCWKIDSLPKLTNMLDHSIQNSGAEVGSFSVPADGQEGTIERTDNFLAVKLVENSKGEPTNYEVIFTSEDISSDLQLWTRGTADSDGFFTLTNKSTGEQLTATTIDGVPKFIVQGK